VVQQPGQKDEHCVERETHLAARHDLVDAVVQHSHHVQNGHQGSPQAGHHRPVVDEVQKLQVLAVTAAVAPQQGFGAVGDDKDTQVVHLCWDAEGVD